jgi:hypothetical protein
MYKNLTFLLFLMLGLVCISSAQDADVLIRNPDAAMPVIDGVVDDIWSMASEQTISITVSGSAPSSAADCSGLWRALWSYDHIYALVVVKDDALINDSGGGSNKWNDDSVEFYIDGDNSKGAAVDENDHQYTCRWNNEVLEEASAIHNGAPSLVGFEYAIATTNDGYIYEARVPWTSIMGTGPTPGHEIGIEMWINDDDNGGDRDLQISWYGTNGNGWNTPSMWATGMLVAGNIAGKPDPADASIHPATWATLGWLAGPTAVSHDVYVGESFDDVNDAAHDSDLYQGNQTTTFFVIGFPGFPFPEGLVSGKTYYWRIDEITAEGAVYKGNVWSFTVPPKIAYNPTPVEGAQSIETGVVLQWTAGFGAKLHTVYIGEDFDTVANATGGPTQGMLTYSPGPLKFAKTYYWRVDEYDGANTYKGDVWSFTTLGAVSGPSPANGAVGVKPTVVLGWVAGEVAASHEVYFGTAADAVKNAAKSSPEYKGPKALGEESYAPGKLTLNTTYYWRIDEVNGISPDSPWAGDVWSFTTGDFFVIDDFEDYDVGDNQIWYAWHDGLGYGTPGTADYYAGNGTGAAVGDETTASYTEETITHGGDKSMPVSYDNNKQGFAKYSEVEHKLTDQRDWTEQGVTELSLWFRGYPAYVGSFAEGPTGTFTITGSGADIWDLTGLGTGYHDEFHFAYKTLAGAGSITAKVVSLEHTNDWAKAGVMIRETLDPGSKHAFAAITPTNGVASQGRIDTAGASFNYNQTGVAAPYWVKLERSISGNFTVSHSTNGTSWQAVTGAVVQSIQMGTNVYIGLAVTSHDPALTCKAVFSNVTTTGTVTGQWTDQDIGILSNDAEPLYVAVSNSAGNPAVVVNDDPAAATLSTWTQWIIPLQAFADQGINLANVDKIAIGLGTKGNMTTAGGSGKMFIDDIRLNQPEDAAGQ